MHLRHGVRKDYHFRPWVMEIHLNVMVFEGMGKVPPAVSSQRENDIEIKLDSRGIALYFVYFLDGLK